MSITKYIICVVYYVFAYNYYVITLYCIYGMFLIDYGTPVLFKSLSLKLFIKALLSRLLDTSAIEIHYYSYYFVQAKTLCRYGCMYFLAALVLVCVDVMVMSSA